MSKMGSVYFIRRLFSAIAYACTLIGASVLLLVSGHFVIEVATVMTNEIKMSPIVIEPSKEVFCCLLIAIGKF